MMLFEDVPLAEALERAENSELIGFFDYNRNHPEERTPYHKFPEKFIWEKNAWRIRKQGSSTIARVYSVHPAQGDVFYLRMLLVDVLHNHSAGKKSFDDMRMVNGDQYDTYQGTCQALGLLEDDYLWDLVMVDAQREKMPRQMRELFSLLLSEVNLSDPKKLFETYWESMAEDYENQLLPPDNSDNELIKAMLLLDIQEHLQANGKGELMLPIELVT